MSAERFNRYEVAKMYDQIQEGGFHFERDLLLGGKMQVVTSEGTYQIYSTKDGLHITGDEPFSDEPTLIRIYGIPQKNEGLSPGERMDHNYINPGDKMEILMVKEGKQVNLGPIKEFKIL